jgi:hypothetical protein
MKITPTKIVLLAALVVAGSFSARAQSNNTPGDADYARFAAFITDRNIFDPNRYPHDQRSSGTRIKRTKTRSNGPQGVTFVGTMAYEKGYFAFFNAGDSDLKKVVSYGGEIADYTVKDISATSVKLIGKDKKEVTMKIGDQMLQEGGAWKVNDDTGSSAASEPATTTETDNSSSTTDANSTTDAAPAAPSASLQSNDILKRLMEKRAKENQ